MPAPGVFTPRVTKFLPIGEGSPRVSVVMSTWNDTRFLRETVESILAQTFTDFEFIIIDDCSARADEVRALELLDSRIRVYRLERNVGAAEAGNQGVARAKAPFIARTDYDDIADPTWLESALKAFAGDPELGLVATWVRLISEHGDFLEVDRTPVSDFAIRFTMLSHNPFYHSTIVYRRELLERVGGIEPGQNETHDHRLWRAMLPHCRMCTIPEPLVRYRYMPAGIAGLIDPGTKRLRTRHIRLGLWQELGHGFPIEDSELAEEVDNFLRERPCAKAQLWPEVVAVIRLAIAATRAKGADFVRPRDEAERGAFIAMIEARLDRGPIGPPSFPVRVMTALRRRGLRRVVADIVRRTRRAARLN